MEITGAGGVSGPKKIQNKKIRATVPTEAVTPGKSSDKVEFSEAARFLQGLERIPSVRVDKIRSLRQQIEKGEYETPEKLQIAIEKLLEELTA
ncbi:flagellar biosynthesis anti-sigma factor FlgM [Planctomycetota bacterium]